MARLATDHDTAANQVLEAMQAAKLYTAKYCAAAAFLTSMSNKTLSRAPYVFRPIRSRTIIIKLSVQVQTKKPERGEFHSPVDPIVAKVIHLLKRRGKYVLICFDMFLFWAGDRQS